MELFVNRELCIGAGRCAWAAPEVFDQDDDGVVVLLDATPEDRLRDRVSEAVTMCPVEAIRLADQAPAV